MRGTHICSSRPKSSGLSSSAPDTELQSARGGSKRSEPLQPTPSPKDIRGRSLGRGSEAAGHTAYSYQEPPLSPPPVKIGPPRGHKRKRRLVVDSQDDTRSSASYPPMHAQPNDQAAEEEPPSSPRADAINGHAPEVDPGDWQHEFDSHGREVDLPQDTLNRDALVPETQPLDGPDSPRAATPELPDTVALGPKLPGGSSVKSRMKPRSGSSTSGRKVSTALPAILLSSNRRPTRKLPNVGEPDEPDVPRAPVLRPIPVLSPSVFRPHLPVQELEPPTSSIEQFSSPEKGSKGAVRNIFRKVKRCIKATDTMPLASTRDDESLRLRGQQLAEEAVARNRRSIHSEDDYSHLFRESASPEPADSSSADEEEAMVESTLSEPNDVQEVGRTEVPIPQEVESTGDPTGTLANTYMDFDAGQTEQPAPVEDVAEPRPLAEELTTGPNMTGVKPKIGFLQEVRKNRTMVSRINSLNEILLLSAHRRVA